MILYHGSNTIVKNIHVGKCKPHKDFGRGFYLTSIESQTAILREEYMSEKAE